MVTNVEERVSRFEGISEQINERLIEDRSERGRHSNHTHQTAVLISYKPVIQAGQSHLELVVTSSIVTPAKAGVQRGSWEAVPKLALSEMRLPWVVTYHTEQFFRCLLESHLREPHEYRGRNGKERPNPHYLGTWRMGSRLATGQGKHHEILI